MTNPLTIALAQTPGSPHPEENLKTARRLTAEAADRGARLIVFPEMFMAIPPKTGFLTDLAEPSLEDGPFVSGLAQLADERDLHLVAGVWERIPASDRVHNTAVWIGPDGRLRTAYRKLHLFDALSVRESRRMAPGHAPPEVLSVGDFTAGLAVCYDLRFPEHFRYLSRAGADLMVVPAAWYAGPLKEAHWLTLLRARAIENTAYLAGAGLTGAPFTGRSAVFDPFGVPLADGGEGAGLVMATLDPDRVRSVREALPSLTHRREDVFKGSDAD